jgi:uncharacterized protein (TIGR00730 family)
VARVAVFCGSRSGADERYAAAALALADALAARGLGLVYGGASVGLMGILADAALAAGVEVIGVIPDGLFDREIAHLGLTELHAVPSLAERKALMAERADAFVALPGGYGTLDEVFEMVTWAQLGVHAKRCGLLEVGQFWAPLRTFLDGAEGAGFVRRSLLDLDTDPGALLDRLLP